VEVEGEHGVEHARVNRRRRLNVHVERAARDADALDDDGILFIRRRRGRLGGGGSGERAGGVREGRGHAAAAEEDEEEAAGEGHGREVGLGDGAAAEMLPFRRRGDLGIIAGDGAWGELEKLGSRLLFSG
jgi:hypothetical protein